MSQALRQGKGVIIPKFGKFFIQNNIPVFQCNTSELQANQAYYNFGLKPLSVIEKDLSSHLIQYSVIAQKSGCDKTTVQNAIKSIIREIKKSIQSKTHYEIDIPAIGMLIYNPNLNLIGVKFQESLFHFNKHNFNKTLNFQTVKKLGEEDSMITSDAMRYLSETMNVKLFDQSTEFVKSDCFEKEQVKTEQLAAFAGDDKRKKAHHGLS